MCAGPAAGLAVRLAAELTAGCTAGAAGVADRAGVLRAVLVVLVVWFEEFLALSSSCSRSISALAAASSAWGVETVIVSPLDVFKGPAVALPAAVFLGIVVV